MSIGLILQFVGGALSILGVVVGLIGIYVSPQGENIVNYFTINQPRELYSAHQSVVWPSMDEDKLYLNLDNFGKIYVWGEGTDNSIAMATNVVPRTSPGIRVPGQFETRNVIMIEGVKGSKKYYFDTDQRQVVEFHIADRRFVVRLVEIKDIIAEDESTGGRKETGAHEYVFQIREIE